MGCFLAILPGFYSIAMHGSMPIPEKYAHPQVQRMGFLSPRQTISGFVRLLLEVTPVVPIMPVPIVAMPIMTMVPIIDHGFNIGSPNFCNLALGRRQWQGIGHPHGDGKNRHREQRRFYE
jgi:hypothetical protein